MVRWSWLCVLVLGACGGADGDSAEPVPPTFTEVSADVMAKSCALSTCHAIGEADASQSLELDPADTQQMYDALVNGVSAANGSAFVVPGDAMGSYLVLKLNGDASIDGGSMPPPFGLADVEPDAYQMVVDWIDAGAAND